MPSKDSERSANLAVTLSTVIASALAYQFTKTVGLTTGYWAAITAVVVCQSEVDTTIRAARDRIIGTGFGVLVGWLTAYIWHEHVLLFACALFLVLSICNWFRLETAGRLAAVAMSIVVLVHRAEPVWRVALERFVEVSIGICTALLVTILFRRTAALGKR